MLIGVTLALWLWLRPHPPQSTAEDPDGVGVSASEGPTVERRSSGHYQPRRRSPGAVSATAIEDPSAGAGVLEGVVLNWETNEPVGEAELTFAHGESVSSTLTNSEGGFEFRAGRPGTYELATVTAEGFLPFAPEWGHSPIRLEARQGRRIRDIVIHLHPAVEFIGSVVSPQGAPVEGAEVVMLSANQGQSALAPLQERFTSDERGEFTFEAAAGALLEARHEDYAPGRVRIDQRAQYHKRVTVRLGTASSALLSDESIAGVVIDGAGRPVDGALVVARAAFRRARHLSRSSQALTDESGHYVLEGLDRGLYHISASFDGLMPAHRANIPVGSDDVELTLREGARLAGVVTDAATGEAVPGFSVVVERSLTALRRAPYRTESFFDAEGRYELGGLEPREYAISITSHGYAPSEPLSVSIPPNSSRVTANFTLSRGGNASGVIVDAETGGPVADAQVSLEMVRGQSQTPVPVTARTVTDFNGRFEIRGLSPGRRSLIVNAEGYHRRMITGLEVSEDGSLGPLDVELSPTEEGEDPSLELTGIGAVLAPRRTALVVVRVIEEGGAAEVGLRPGDAILWVDGQPVEELGFTGAIERIRGPEGTTVRLNVRRANGEAFDLVVPRRRVRS